MTFRPLLWKEISRPFKCKVCDSRFSQKGNLEQHIASVHEGNKPFKCEIRDYSCSEKSKINMLHWFIKGNKPLKCEVCNYRSCQKSDLKWHSNVTFLIMALL